MPYVTPDKRERLDSDLLGAKTAGELGYVIGVVCDEYLAARGAESDTGSFRYQHLCDVIGTLESIKLDLFRLVIAPYEAKVQAENGDVYTCVPRNEFPGAYHDIMGRL